MSLARDVSARNVAQLCRFLLAHPNLLGKLQSGDLVWLRTIHDQLSFTDLEIHPDDLARLNAIQAVCAGNAAARRRA